MYYGLISDYVVVELKAIIWACFATKLDTVGICSLYGDMYILGLGWVSSTLSSVSI